MVWVCEALDSHWMLCLHGVPLMLPDKALLCQRCGITASVYGDTATQQALQR